MHVVAHRIQPRIGCIAWSSTLAALSVARPAKVPEAARQQFHGVIRPVQQWSQRWIGYLQRLATGPVVSRYATLEKRIFTPGCMAVETVHRALQLLGIDPAALRQLRQCATAVQVTAALIVAGGEREGLGPADTIATLRGMVADQPGFRRFPCGVAANSAFMKSW